MIENFFVAGINYKKSDSDVRSKYALTAEQCAHFYKGQKPNGVEEFFILSTCNRTEIYGIARSANHLISIFHPHQHDIKVELTKDVYIKSGWQAVNHLFEVTAGLDSQLVGDYEIMGQTKQAFSLAKQAGATGSNLERIVTNAFAAAKDVRTNTMLSSGTVSTSYAAVRFIKRNYFKNRPVKVLVIGAGEIGAGICRNLSDYFPGNDATVINRTFEKASALARETGMKASRFENLNNLVSEADVIVCATGSSTYILTNDILPVGKKQLLIDMSMPRNVQPLSKLHADKSLLNIDDISAIKDESLQIRNEEIPGAQKIIEGHVARFREWVNESANRKLIKEYKQTALRLEKHLVEKGSVCAAGENEKNYLLKKNVQQIALNISSRNDKGCLYIETLGKYYDALSN